MDTPKQTAVINREIDRHGEVNYWALVTTAPSQSAQRTRSTYKLRPAIGKLKGDLHLKRRQDMNRRTCARLRQMLGPSVEPVAIYCQQRLCLLSLPEFT